MADNTNINKPIYHLRCVILYILFLTVSAKSKLQVSPPRSWWEARTYCMTEHNSDLFIPTHDQPRPNLHPLNGTVYWVGGLQTSEWLWTDNSTPFVHMGYMVHNVSSKPRVEITGNNVEQCYSHCPDFPYIGLSESRCYCIDNPPTYHSTSKKNESRCPGNMGEKCGDSSGMSVYKTEIQFTDRTGQCVYVSKLETYTNLYTKSCKNKSYSICSEKDETDFVRGRSCFGNETFYRCESGICTTCSTQQWLEANKTCKLIKVTNKNNEKIFNFLSKGESNDVDYWIGLRRRTMKMWINGSEFGHETSSHKRNRSCLALRYSRVSTWTTSWEPCENLHQALCDHIEHAHDHNEGMNLKLYIGSGVGLVLLTALMIGVVFVTKRRDQACFQRNQRSTGDSVPQEETIPPLYLTLEPAAAQNRKSSRQLITTLHPGRQNTKEP